jgi:MYXO-CTERM domain-containing protein
LIVAGGIILNSAVAVAEPGDQVPPDGGCDADDRSCILRTLKEAYAHDPAPPLLLQLARVYEGAGRKGAALTSYLEYQRTCKEAGCVDITARVDELRPHVGQLNLDLVGLVSQITLDGEVIARGDAGAPLFVDPGEHVLEVRWSNGDVDAQPATVAAGETLSVRLHAGPEPQPVPVYGAPPPPGAGRGCGCGEPGVPSASSPGSDQGGPPVGFAVLAGAAAAAIARRRPPRGR